METTRARAAALLTVTMLVGSAASAAEAQASAGPPLGPDALTAKVVGGRADTTYDVARDRTPAVGGFRVVRELRGAGVAGYSPARGELWLVTSGDDGAMRLEHLRQGRWTSQPLGASGGPSSAGLAGTGRNDVWLTIGGELRHFDGRRWQSVARPAVDGAPLAMQAMYTPRPGVLYAAATTADFRVLVYRYVKGRWISLGAPGLSLWTHMVRQIIVVDGSVLVWFEGMTHEFYGRRDSEWSRLYGLPNVGPSVYGYIGGWYPRAYDDHLVLGATGYYGMAPTCLRWTGAEPLRRCVTTAAPTASAMLRDGSIVMAESDYFLPGFPGGADVEGGFALRRADGVEVALTGDPGVRSSLVMAEAHRLAAWAVTAVDGPTGRRYVLQRYER